jgi:hypothetical protein
MSCGFSKSLLQTNNVFENALASNISYKTIYLYTAYLGRVSVKVGILSDNTVLMECKGVGTTSDIIIKEVDLESSNLDANYLPKLNILSDLKSVVINININKEVFFLIQIIELDKAIVANNNINIKRYKNSLKKFKILEPILSSKFLNKYNNVNFTDEQLRFLYVKNSVVDVHFNTCMMIQFLQDTLNIPSINNNKVLLSVVNIKNLDNAYFTGDYMVYGNGKTYFYPLTSIDVISHELSHSIVQETAGLEYKAESGALNESFADCIATAFEFWIYKIFNEDIDKDNDLQGESDWLIGEDIGKTIKYLRDMQNPETANQPKSYKGKHWVNTTDTSAKNDNGGVHINSGVSNHCFYLLSQKIGVEKAFPIFYNCLLKLTKKSNFAQFSIALLECSSSKLKRTVNECLVLVNLSKALLDTEPEIDLKSDSDLEPDSCTFPNDHIPVTSRCCPHCFIFQKQKKNTNTIII